MATTTPNFGWAVPTSTDLVKDGAVAIETLGDSIDASLVDLKGGTTGQVLAKASNTDMDFTWSTDASGISPTIFAAKGDLLGASANDTPAVLTVGANGETLVADSSTSTGLRYTAGNPISNPVLNSAFQVWQRGTSIACSTTAYTADRWQGYRGVAGGTISRQATGDTTNLPNIQYCARVQRDSGNTSTATIYLAQTLETVNSIPYAGKTVTFSFYARKGANLSSAGAVRVTLQQGAGTDQNVLTSMASSTVVNVDASLTTTWQRFTGTGTVNTTSTQLGLYVDFNPTGTAGAADYLEITGVQIDIGSVALPFRTYAGTIQGELAACQRYYFRVSGTNVIPYTAYARDTGAAFISVTYPSVMRVSPTTLDFSALELNLPGTANYTITNALLNTPANNATTVELTASGLTQWRPYLFKTSSAGYIGFSAEL
jgi:hypothetical protein